MSAAPPVQPRSSRSLIREEGETLEVVLYSQQVIAGLFMSFWLIGWSVGCVALAHEVFIKQQLFMLLFALPFWVSWIFVAAILLWMLKGRELLILSPMGLAYESRVVSFVLAVRMVPFRELVSIREVVCSVDTESGTTWGIEIATQGRSVVIGKNLSSVERQWLVWKLTNHFENLQLSDAESRGDFPASDTSEKPSDSRWTEEVDVAKIHFVEQGQIEWVTVGGLLFVNGFWNGIVAVFVGVLLGLAPDKNPPVGKDWWFMFLFLIPFVAIGLAMFAALLFAITEPFRTTRWTFTTEEILCEVRRFSWTRQTAHAVTSPGRIGVRDDLTKTWMGWNVAKSAKREPTGTQFGLLISDDKSREICSIHDLTRGEAYWMKRQIETILPEWNELARAVPNT